MQDLKMCMSGAKRSITTFFTEDINKKKFKEHQRESRLRLSKILLNIKPCEAKSCFPKGDTESSQK